MIAFNIERKIKKSEILELGEILEIERIYFENNLEFKNSINPEFFNLIDLNPTSINDLQKHITRYLDYYSIPRQVLNVNQLPYEEVGIGGDGICQEIQFNSLHYVNEMPFLISESKFENIQKVAIIIKNLTKRICKAELDLLNTYLQSVKFISSIHKGIEHLLEERYLPKKMLFNSHKISTHFIFKGLESLPCPTLESHYILSHNAGLLLIRKPTEIIINDNFENRNSEIHIYEEIGISLDPRKIVKIKPMAREVRYGY
jgi:hypothetical protein